MSDWYDSDPILYSILDEGRQVTNPSRLAYRGGSIEFVFDMVWKTPFSRLSPEERAAVVPADRKIRRR